MNERKEREKESKQEMRLKATIQLRMMHDSVIKNYIPKWFRNDKKRQMKEVLKS